MYPYTSLLITMFVSHLTANVVDLREFDDDDENYVTERHKVGALQIRCTRRFSPGVCMEDVKPVWTYNFHLQNCTERLGCRQKAVTNRFLSYRRCMVSCQSLVQIYNHILSQSVLDDKLSHQRASLLRRSEELGSTEEPNLFNSKEEPNSEYSDEDSHSEENDDPLDRYDPYVENPPGREDPDKIALEDLLPPDLDRLPPDFSHFDPIHRPLQL